jgi:hypothetical protein
MVEELFCILSVFYKTFDLLKSTKGCACFNLQKQCAVRVVPLSMESKPVVSGRKREASFLS